MYITTCKINDQCKFNARSRAPKAGDLAQPRGMDGEGFGRGFRMGGHKPTHG